ncbi:MAG: hypothetical protein Q9208_005207 [Pyrenodesmia sp. 3 TL-2023]
MANALRNITSFSPTSQLSAKKLSPGKDADYSKDDVSELQRDTSKVSDIPSDTEVTDYPQISDVNHLIDPRDTVPAGGLSDQTVHTGSFMRRNATSNKSPTMQFRFGKAQPFNANTQPRRNPAAIMQIPLMKAGQPTHADGARDLMTDRTSSGVEAGTSQEETHPPEGPHSKRPGSEPTSQGSSKPQSSSYASNPNSNSQPQTRYSTPIETMPDDASIHSGSPSIAIAKASADHCSTGEPQKAAPEEVQDSVEQEEATATQGASGEEKADRHDEDTEMLDGQTMVNALPESPQNVHGTPTSSSLSTETHPVLEQSSGLGQDETREQMEIEASEASVTAKTNIAQDVHDCPRVSHHELSPPAGPPCSHINDNQNMGTEELMKALAVRVRSEKQKQEDMKAREEAMEGVLRDAKAICKALNQQLQESEARVTAQEDELTKYRQQIPQWQERVKKLGKFVNGLNNDHGRLRDAAQAIEKEQQDLRADKDAMEKMVEGAKAIVEHERVQRKEMILKARYDAGRFEQALNTKSLDLLKENTRLRDELDRNVRLQKTMTQSSSSYEALSQQLAQQEAVMGSRTQALYDMVQTSISNNSLSSQEHMSKLQECLAVLQASRKDARVVPADVQHLQSLITENNTRLCRLISDCGSSIEATDQLGGRLATQFDGQVQKLLKAIESGHLSQNQITDLREVKAKLAEQLNASEISLADYRRTATSLRNQEQLHLQKISALEAEVITLRNQTHESPLMALRLHDSEKQCVSIKEQLTACQSQLAAARAEIESSTQETSELRDLLEITNRDLTEQQATVERLRAEKAAFESQAIVNEERIRADLSRASDNNVKSRTGELRNEIKSLRHQASVTAEALQTGKSKLDQLQADKAAASDMVRRLESSVSELQNQAKTSAETISRLEQSIKTARQEGAEKDAHLRGVQAELQEMREAATQENEASREAISKLNNAEAERLRLESERNLMHEQCDDLKEQLAATSQSAKAQEAEIVELLGKLAASNTANTTSISSPGHSLNRSRSSERHSAVVEDSQEKVPRQRRSILKPGRVIEDSQEQNGQIQQGSSRALSSDELSRGEPISHMSRGARDLGMASSSPLTDIRRTLSPFLDGAAMYPQSPSMSQGNNVAGLGPRGSGGSPYRGAANHHEGPVSGNSWAYNTTVTSTKTHSMTASIGGISPFPANGGQPRASAHKSSQSSTIKKSDSQKELESHQNLKGLGSKRPHPGVAGSDDQRKRRRMSSEADKHGLGPTQTSPIKSVSSSRRKSTLRQSQQGKQRCKYLPKH